MIKKNTASMSTEKIIPYHVYHLYPEREKSKGIVDMPVYIVDFIEHAGNF